MKVRLTQKDLTVAITEYLQRRGMGEVHKGRTAQLHIVWSVAGSRICDETKLAAPREVAELTGPRVWEWEVEVLIDAPPPKEGPYR